MSVFSYFEESQIRRFSVCRQKPDVSYHKAEKEAKIIHTDIPKNPISDIHAFIFHFFRYTKALSIIFSLMTIKPPHLITEEELEAANTLQKDFRGVGAQGPSKYGKGGARGHKGKKRSDRAKR